MLVFASCSPRHQRLLILSTSQVPHQVIIHSFLRVSPRFSLFDRREAMAAGGMREVRVNTRHPHFPSNAIRNTKYNPFNFVPKTLVDQFRRRINVYFLVIALLQLNDRLTPVHPATTIAPLVFVFLMAMLKELADDYQRRVQDRVYNERRYTLCRRGKLQQVRSADIRVGDVLLIKQEEEMPADMILLKSSDPEGTCFIQTTNLDGEADLKIRQALPATKGLLDTQIAAFMGVVQCSKPSSMVYSFAGNLILPWAPEVPISLGNEQLLLAATSLKHTDHIFGAVIYTGPDTKFGCNKREPPFKESKVDVFIDRIAIGVFICQLVLALAFGAVGYDWYLHEGRRLAYLGYEPGGFLPAEGIWPSISYGLVYPTRFFLLLSIMIPIPLRLTLEFCRVMYSQWIKWDDLMVDDHTSARTVAHTTSLNEDLGQIEYVLADKTGTLTENLMTLKKCSIANHMYGHSPASPDIWKDPALHAKLVESRPMVVDFFRCLALNHSAQPTHSKGDGRLMYATASPEDDALVHAAADIGVQLVERSNQEMRLWLEHGNVAGRQHERWQLLHLLEFSSARRRMSVIVRELAPETRTKSGAAPGKLKIYIKGADDAVMPRFWPGQDLAPTKRHVDFFGDLGLRTLVLGVRELEEEYYAEWAAKVAAVRTALNDREEKLASLYEEIEREFMLLGVTAIEDALQDGVPEAIADLRRANIKVWMVTGDKHATAVQVARSCRLVSPPSSRAFMIDVIGKNEDEVGDSVNEHLQSLQEGKYKSSGFTELNVVIEGKAVEAALQETYGRREAFAKLALQANTVICCRASPAQKAALVRLLKEQGKMTLAIGDGGNDVQMIQDAHIGVGVAGKEGLQAARASDYSTPRFRFLKRLLLVHGRYSYKRTSIISLYSFYRSFLACTMQIIHNAFSGYSGASVIPSLYFSLWTILTLPFTFSFALDKDVTDRSCETFPALYREGQKGDALNLKAVFKWTCWGVTQGTGIYFLCLFSFGAFYVHPLDGGALSLVATGMACYSCGILVLFIVAFIEHDRISAMNCVLLFGTVLLFILLFAITSNLSNATWIEIDLLQGSFERLFTDPTFVLGVVAISCGVTLPQIISKFMKFYFRPAPHQVVQLYERKQEIMAQKRLAHSALLSTFKYQRSNSGHLGQLATVVEDGNLQDLVEDSAYEASLSVGGGAAQPAPMISVSSSLGYPVDTPRKFGAFAE